MICDNAVLPILCTNTQISHHYHKLFALRRLRASRDSVDDV